MKKLVRASLQSYNGVSVGATTIAWVKFVHRRELEDQWRERAQVALHRYHKARDAARFAQAEHSHGLMPAPDGAFAVTQALGAETAALSEYRRVLIIFNELLISGKMPPDEPGY